MSLLLVVTPYINYYDKSNINIRILIELLGITILT